jgi:excisionase family DNA binding protein
VLDNYYTVSQAATYLNISRPRIYQLVAGGKLEGIRLGDIWLLSRSSVERRAQLVPPLPAGQRHPGPSDYRGNV